MSFISIHSLYLIDREQINSTSAYHLSISRYLPLEYRLNPLILQPNQDPADPIVSIIIIHQNLWLIGALTTEVWIGTGAADYLLPASSRRLY